MRKRSIPFFVLALIASVAFWRMIHVLTRTGLSYEFGSAAWPIPLHVKLLGVIAELLFLGGIVFPVIDFVSWAGERRN